jgi:hypothetical protein
MLKRTLLLPALLLPVVARADVPASCNQPHEIDRYQLLRRLSLDLRGHAPTYEEYEALDATPGTTLPPAAVDVFLAGDTFRAQMRRYHEQLFWPNVSLVRLHGQETLLATYQNQGQVALSIAAAGRAYIYRGTPKGGAIRAPACDDYEHKDFDPKYPGQYRPVNPKVDVDGVRHDGWRLVAPYWDPATKIKVCAYEAQETMVAANNAACHTASGRARAECGCGPGLKFCYGPGRVTDNAIALALREQLGRAVDEVTTGGKPYTDLLLATRSSENGPIAHWKKWLAPSYTLNLTYNVPARDEATVDKEFLDATWAAVDRPTYHAGVVTTPAYLLRFQTDRGRANRFRIDFVCEQFVPPAKPTNAPGCSQSDPDLTNRCVCQYCHAKLEPLAAHFGLYAEAGTAAMFDPMAYPKQNPSCVGTTGGLCGRFYVTDKEAHRPGWLQAYQFADTHPEYATHLEKGPRALAQQVIADGSFARCTVRRLFAHLVRREMRVAGDDASEQPLLEELAKGFVAAKWSFPWLVKKIVSLPAYRRVR